MNLREKLQNFSLYKIIMTLFVVVGMILVLAVYFISYLGFKNIAQESVRSKLSGDIGYIYDTIGQGTWHIEEDGFYKGSTYLGNATEETAYLDPFLYIEDQTTTFSYVFMKCSDEGLTWTGDKQTGYQQGHFIRVAGSTKNPKGESIVGTYMDKLVADIIDVDGEYIGEANVAGGKIYCIYRALLNDKDETVGCIVVGINISTINSEIYRYVNMIAALIAGVIFLSGFIIMRFIKDIALDIDKTKTYISDLRTHDDSSVLELKTHLMQPISESINALHDAEVELEKRKRLAETDNLTGLCNRVGLDSWLSVRLKDLQTLNRQIGVILIDVDYFKEYNDNYGHPQGDICLKAVGNVLASVSNRYGCQSYRIGGDEFMLVVCGEAIENMENIMQFVKDSIFEKHLIHEFSKCSDRVTLSQGGYVLTMDVEKTFGTIYNLADGQLYKTKNGGKNGYHFARD